MQGSARKSLAARHGTVCCTPIWQTDTCAVRPKAGAIPRGSLKWQDKQWLWLFHSERQNAAGHLPTTLIVQLPSSVPAPLPCC